MTVPSPPRVLVWADPAQVDVILSARDECGGSLTGVSGRTPDETAALAEMLGTQPIPDLREGMHRSDFDVLWLAAPDPIDHSVRQLVRDLELPTITSQPRPVSIAEVIAEPIEATTAQFAPMLRRGPGYRRALDLTETLGEVRCLHILSACSRHQGSLFARLYDAMDLVDATLGEVIAVSAMWSEPPAGVPDTLDRLHGHLTTTLRTRDDRVACITASDAAVDWTREVVMIGETGRLMFTDAATAWLGDENRDNIVDMLEDREAPVTPGALIGLQIVRVLEDLDATQPPLDSARRLAMCEAARLSARTGQTESPGRVLEMMSRV